MLVRLKNTGLSTRIFHDTKGKQHVCRVNGTIELDVHDQIADRYKRGQTAGDPLEIEFLGQGNAEPRPSFTLRPGEGAPNGEPGMGSAAQAHALENATQPQTRREIEGSMPRPPVVAEEIPVERLHDPITANAVQADTKANAAPVEPEVPQEPTTAAEVIALIEAGGVSEADQLRLTRAVLPKDITMVQRPKPAQIMNALRRAAANS